MGYLRFLFIFIYIAFLTLISWDINGNSWYGIDDANIYMVYMKNFANGHGLVYNIRGERVEGFTSLLWTLMGSLFFFISSQPEIFLLVTNILLVSCLLYRITCFLGKNGQNLFLNKKSLWFLSIIGITPGFIDWTVLALMDTGLWCFLLTITILTILNYNLSVNKLKHYSALSLLYVLLVICRPESMLWVPVFIILNAAQEYYISKSMRLVILGLLSSFMVFLLSLFFLFLWRFDYFGYLLPNTYYAKISSNRMDNLILGASYIYTLFIQKPFLLFILIHATFFVFIKTITKQIFPNMPIFILFIVIIISLLIPFYTGGDHFGLHRFIMPSIPMIVLIWTLILKSNLFDKPIIPILMALAVFLSNEHNIKETYYHKNFPIRHEWVNVINGRNTSEKLNKFFVDHSKLPSQGVLSAGGTAFAYKGETIDLLGLNNTKMAHAKKVKDKSLLKNHASFNPDVFFELSPDIFWYFNSRFLGARHRLLKKLYINSKSFAAIIFKKIHLNPKFIKRYGFYRINRHNENEALQIFANRLFMKSLDTSKYQIWEIEYE